MAINYTRTNRPAKAARTVEPSIELRTYILGRTVVALPAFLATLPGKTLVRGENVNLDLLASVRQS